MERTHRMVYRGAAVLVYSDDNWSTACTRAYVDEEFARHRTAIDAAWEANDGNPPWEQKVKIADFLEVAH